MKRFMMATMFLLFIISSLSVYGGSIEQKLEVEDSLKTIHIQSFEESYKEEEIVQVAEKITTPTTIKVNRGAFVRSIKVSKEDYDALVRIVEAECTGQTVEDKMNVAQCVLNRVKEEGIYPCRIKDVIFAKGQFQPTFDGRYEKVKITKESVEAVNRVLKNPSIHDCIYFQAHGCDSRWFRTLKFVFKDESHKYYR